MRLVARLEDREAAQRLLEVNLLDRSADSEAYSRWPLV